MRMRMRMRINNKVVVAVLVVVLVVVLVAAPLAVLGGGGAAAANPREYEQQRQQQQGEEGKGSYRAAVFQHYRTKEAKRAEWSKMQNVASYEKATATAASKGAQIIVFPEVGLGGNAISRALNLRFAEDVPDAAAKVNPCSRNGTAYCKQRPALCALSCMAKRNEVYAVVGMNDLKACNKSADPKCPRDGAYIFNTATVFDPTGLVIARYHKKHIFSPFPVFDTPEKAQVRHFDTSFGVRFGIFICFDSLFPDPPLELVKLGVQHYVFPTDWSNIPPILTATQYQQSWSRSFNTSFLAANTAEHGTSGSGIYACGRPIVSFFNYTADGLPDQRLLIADVPKQPCGPLPSASSNSKGSQHAAAVAAASASPLQDGNDETQPSQEHTPSTESTSRSGRHNDDSHCGTVGIDPCACDLVDAAPGKSGTLTAEFNGLRCTAHYSFSPNQTTTERYGLVVYSGTAWFLEPLPAQLCTFVRCATTEACLTPDVSGDFIFPAHTLLDSFSIEGNFTYAQEQQFALMVESGGQILPKSALDHSVNRIQSSGSLWPRKLLAASILGRPWNSTAATGLS